MRKRMKHAEENPEILPAPKVDNLLGLAWCSGKECECYVDATHRCKLLGELGYRVSLGGPCIVIGAELVKFYRDVTAVESMDVVN